MTAKKADVKKMKQATKKAATRIAADTRARAAKRTQKAAAPAAAQQPAPKVTKQNAAAMQIEPTTVGDLHERAVLVQCVEHTWMGGTIDRTTSAEIKEEKGASGDVGHFWLRLVPKAAIRPIANAGNAVKGFHRSHTLPWLDGDVRMLPASQIKAYTDGIRKLIDERTVAEEAFFSQYEHWMKEAEKTHGKLFDATKYPTLDQLRGKFGFDIAMYPIPNVQDWRLNLSDDQTAEMRRQVEQRYIDIQKDASRHLCETLREVVEHMQKRLSDPEAKFKNSLVENVCKQLDIVAALNVTNDPELEAMRLEIATSLAAAKPDELRTDPVKRTATAKKASDIMARMASYMGAST